MGNLDFDQRTFVNEGAFHWNAGTLRSGNGGSFTNAAGATLVDAGADAHAVSNGFGGGFSFANEGSYTKTGAGAVTVSVPFLNSGSLGNSNGTMSFTDAFTDANGSLLLANDASFSFANPLVLGSGSLSGAGTVSAPSVSTAGTLSPGNSPGTLNITGDLTLLGTSETLIEIAGLTPGTQYDLLNVSGTTILGGALQLSLLGGIEASLLPSDTFTVLVSAGTLSGTFANVSSGLRLTSIDGLGSFEVHFGSSSSFAVNTVVLTNFQAVPEPPTWALLAGGVIISGYIRVRRRAPSVHERLKRPDCFRSE
jgi:hypothetical protein